MRNLRCRQPNSYSCRLRNGPHLFRDGIRHDRMEGLIWLWLLWPCVDDHIARAAGAPGMVGLPIWVALILSLAFSFSLDGTIDLALKKA